jgi:hypothetical protein
MLTTRRKAAVTIVIGRIASGAAGAIRYSRAVVERVEGVAVTRLGLHLGALPLSLALSLALSRSLTRAHTNTHAHACTRAGARQTRFYSSLYLRLYLVNPRNCSISAPKSRCFECSRLRSRYHGALRSRLR